MPSTLEISRKDNLAILSFNRPEVFNSFNKDLALSSLKALEDFEKDSSVRAVMITGNGKAFCAGQDLQEAISDDFEISKVVEKHYNPLITKIRTIAKPVLAAVNGVAAGAGANIAIACDVTVASHSASFIQAFSKIGLVPDSGGTYTLPRIIGFQRASALMMLGDKVSAEEAKSMGMIYQVFPDETFLEESLKVGLKLANMPTIALGYTKHLLNQSMTNSLEAQLELEKEYQYKSTQSVDHQEGIKAFIERRQPIFKGK